LRPDLAVSDFQVLDYQIQPNLLQPRRITPYRQSSARRLCHRRFDGKVVWQIARTLHSTAVRRAQRDPASKHSGARSQSATLSRTVFAVPCKC
jgi:hypothetical protein